MRSLRESLRRWRTDWHLWWARTHMHTHTSALEDADKFIEVNDFDEAGRLLYGVCRPEGAKADKHLSKADELLKN